MRSYPMLSLAVAIVLGAVLLCLGAAQPQNAVRKSYLGFDANDYPGDDALPILRKSFSFAGYWIGPPPGEKSSSWVGKRNQLKGQGFGFLLLWNGRDSHNLKSAADAQQKGKLDAQSAAKAARLDGFPAGSAIFLDIEEGGRLTPAYHTYVHEWEDVLEAEKFRAGVYCSAMPVNEGRGVSITSAKDLQDQLAGRKPVFWIYNDACPPAPGCTFPQTLPTPGEGGFAGAAIWQYAQSPRRKHFTAHCAATYAPDGNCYAPGDAAHKWFLDLNVADSPDPSAPGH